MMILCALVLVLSGERSARADVCQDPRILAELERSRDKGCRFIVASFRDGEEVKDIEIVYVLRERRWSFDMWADLYDLFAMLPDGDLMPLKRGWHAWRAPSGGALDYAYRTVGIENGFCCTDETLVMDWGPLERRGDDLCVVYRMKEPLRGSFEDCDGLRDQRGKIGWADGATSWALARGLVCRRFNSDTGKPCHSPYNLVYEPKLVAGPDGSLHYLVTVRSLGDGGANPTVSDYVYDEYQVEVMSRTVTMLNHHDGLKE
jgi:hypothetical protein